MCTAQMVGPPRPVAALRQPGPPGRPARRARGPRAAVGTESPRAGSPRGRKPAIAVWPSPPGMSPTQMLAPPRPFADFLQRGLTAEGYSVTTAADGTEAGRLAR